MTSGEYRSASARDPRGAPCVTCTLRTRCTDALADCVLDYVRAFPAGLSAGDVGALLGRIVRDERGERLVGAVTHQRVTQIELLALRKVAARIGAVAGVDAASTLAPQVARAVRPTCVRCGHGESARVHNDTAAGEELWCTQCRRESTWRRKMAADRARKAAGE